MPDLTPDQRATLGVAARQWLANELTMRAYAKILNEVDAVWAKPKLKAMGCWGVAEMCKGWGL